MKLVIEFDGPDDLSDWYRATADGERQLEGIGKIGEALNAFGLDDVSLIREFYLDVS